MLLFSTVLDINDSLTKDAFIKLVIDWNQGSPHEENVIHGIDWHGERNVRYGDDKMWLDIQEYRNGNTIAVRYQKVEDDGVIWDTDYVMNFTDMKMSVRLDRSFFADALTVNPKFSTPHFISLLSDGGYLKGDGVLPTTRLPIFIDESNLDILCGVINDTQRFRLPVVYVSKNPDNSDPVDVKWLATKLKGVAHVLVQKGSWLNYKIRQACDSRNEYYGAVGVYFPNPAVQHRRYFYRAYQGFDEFLLEKVVRIVISYANSQAVDTLYTWQGVTNAMFIDRWRSRGEDLIELERAKNSAEFAQELAEMERAEAVQQRAAAKTEASLAVDKAGKAHGDPLDFPLMEIEQSPDHFHKFFLAAHRSRHTAALPSLQGLIHHTVFDRCSAHVKDHQFHFVSPFTAPSACLRDDPQHHLPGMQAETTGSSLCPSLRVQKTVSDRM